MNFNSPIHQSIYSKVVVPSLNRLQGTIEGYVIQVDYTKLTCEVVYSDENSHALRAMKNVSLPKDGDGVFTQGVKNGDRVSISFKNKSKESPYISTVYKANHSDENYLSPYGGRTIRQSRIF
ncbi:MULTISPECIES: hypothetical protein [Bacillus cereus group]|uniref:Uncharacterized protein n=1 Tax=Bacillus thuringiensis subsp. jegathesan TaxID=56955 RepID=A0A9X6MFX8_BACTJ|nr:MULTISPECIES: hypothetical protein [Bacillus cereus group]OJE00222.1 hypothetical protein A9487_21235 [Bacillus cereus]OUB70777.1 hypothetical protein BK750_10545 [Bacillus thuringiensis serovar jegathesan]